MKYHMSKHAFLFLMTLSAITALDSRAASLQRRNPGVDLFTCCIKPPGAATDPTPEMSLLHHTSSEKALAPEKNPASSSAAVELVERPKTGIPQSALYPTQVPNPRFYQDGVPFYVGVVAHNRPLTHVLLIKEVGGISGWRLPEGGWDQNERWLSSAVVREARQTAGLRVSPFSHTEIGHVETRLAPAADGAPRRGRSHYFQLPMQESDLLAAWPNDKTWLRRIVPIEQAMEDLAVYHPEQVDMLKAIKRPGKNYVFPEPDPEPVAAA